MARRGRQCTCCCCPRWTFKRFVVTLRRKKWFLVLTLAVLNAGLLIGGAAIVMYLEADNEQVLRQHHEELMRKLQRLLDECGKLNVPCPSLHRDTMRLIDQTNRIEKDLPVILRWDFKGALVFTATVMTTIGYGWLHPVTPGGRIFTVLFGTISIPTLFLFLAGISEYLVWICQYVNRITFVRLGGSFVTPNGGPRQRYTVMITAVVVLSYLIGISALYQHLASSFKSNEYPKTYEESLYFAFVTFSTIGFGDFVLKDFDDSSSMDALSATGFLLSMLFGLVVLWTLVSVLQNGLQRLVAKADYVVITTAEVDGEGDDEMIHILASKESQLEAETEAWDEATQLLKHAKPLGKGQFMGSPRASRRPILPAHRQLTDDMGGWKYSAPPSPTFDPADSADPVDAPDAAQSEATPVYE